MHEEPFTTRSVENLVEIVKNFNDTTGFIFSTACEIRKERQKSSAPFGRCSFTVVRSTRN